MAQYEINHVCGCTTTHQIYGTNVRGEREEKAEFLKSVPCTDCERERKLNLLKARHPGITDIDSGTKKQNAWATSIRLEAAEKLMSLCKKIEEEIMPTNPDLAKIGIDIIKNTLEIADYQFWIDNRNEVFGESWINREFQKKQG